MSKKEWQGMIFLTDIKTYYEFYHNENNTVLIQMNI
jgi:hypothetical protein